MIALSLLPFLALLATALAQETVPKFGPFCGTPVPVYDNGTKATNWPGYIAELEKHEALNGQGSTDAWGTEGGPIRWPRTGEHQVIIPYCFAQEHDRRNIRNVVENGMAKWIEHLGGPASRTSGHAISFQERKNAQGKPLYCASPTNRDAWNDKVPHDTLAMEYTENKGWGGSMAHEHNHPDRDTYLKITPKALADWDSCWQRVHAHEGPLITLENLCRSIRLTIKYGCTCAAFVKNYVEPGWPIKSNAGFDIASIMHYASVSGYSNQRCITKGEDCPVVAYVDPKDHGKGTRLVEQVRRPSEKDLMWVKRNYPW
ncbi:hypothetical protein J3E74DRAFT_467807 [Bipolaris maydis]|nr:hypothetical protein J3E74DRAFT_467807 [Bipolaris maydis]